MPQWPIRIKLIVGLSLVVGMMLILMGGSIFGLNAFHDSKLTLENLLRELGGSTELLILRLALIGVVFAFLLIAAVALRAGLQSPARQRAQPGAALERQARLVVTAPADSGLTAGVQILVAGSMTIGRDLNNGIVVADPSVSGRHALLDATSRAPRRRFAVASGRPMTRIP